MEFEYSKSRSKWNWVVPSCVFAFLVLMGALLVIPSLTRTPEGGFVNGHMSDASQIITALRIYARDHAGAYPKTLDDLVKSEVIDKETLDRLMLFKPASDGKLQSWIVNIDLKDSDPGDLPLIVAPAPAINGQYIIGMNNGSMGTADKKGYAAAMERLRQFREDRDKKEPRAGR